MIYDKVPVPDVHDYGYLDSDIGWVETLACDEADVLTYGDAREAAGYAAGLAAVRWRDVADELRRLHALCARAMVQPDGWQPIETAPTDDTPVDIWRPSWGGERCTAMCRIDLGRGNIFYAPTKSGPACVRDATHWMPIPEAPK